MKGWVPVLGCLVLLTSLSGVAMADAITFSFVTANQSVRINASGLSVGPALVLLVSNSNLNEVFNLVGTARISTGLASSFLASGGNLTAHYMPGLGIEVEVDSAACTGGAHPGVCLQGIQNSNGPYTAMFGGTGSFQALYSVSYVSPYIPSLFGDDQCGGTHAAPISFT